MRLELYPRGKSTKNNKCLSLFLQLSASHVHFLNPKLYAAYKLIIALIGNMNVKVNPYFTVLFNYISIS